MPTALVICPSQRDRLNMADERILDRFALRFAGQPIGPGFDPRTFVEHMARFGPVADGIFGSSDATGHLASILADDAGLRTRLGAAAKQRALSRPTWDEVARLFFDHLREVAEAHARSPL